MSSLIFQIRQKFLEKAINFYGPYLGAGVKLEKLTKDNRYAKVSMPLTFYNKNYMGTQFGGSLYSMVDPWYMLMLIKNLGRDYIVWDKGATIRFKKPGKGTVTAEFTLTQEVIDEIISEVKRNTKMDKVFKVEIKDKSGTLICEVDKVVYIRKKSDKIQNQV
ncbi:MAG: YiiD C-terminal domain-containing protein [Bdellovibrionales bacterium]|nr:YiiD C-terminal domain-containing protein [Bdellovibrionales bacterium]